jgi:hypothetical protein
VFSLFFEKYLHIFFSIAFPHEKTRVSHRCDSGSLFVTIRTSHYHACVFKEDPFGSSQRKRRDRESLLYGKKRLNAYFLFCFRRDRRAERRGRPPSFLETSLDCRAGELLLWSPLFSHGNKVFEPIKRCQLVHLFPQ